MTGDRERAGDAAAVPFSRASTLADAIPRFCEYLRREGKSEYTIKGFASDLRLLAQFSGPDMRLEEFDTDHLERFLNWLTGERGVPCRPKSYARRVTSLKSFFRWLHESEILPYDPAKPVIQYSARAPLPVILSDDEIERLLAVTDAIRRGVPREVHPKPDARPDLLVRLLLETGIKKSECVNIRLEHIIADDPHKPILFVRRVKPTGIFKERKIPLSPEWMDVLAEYKEQYGIEDRLFPWTARNLEYVLHSVADEAELSGGLSFEMLRWTCAVRDYRAGMDMEKLREKMGLSRISWRETRAKIVQLAERLSRLG